MPIVIILFAPSTESEDADPKKLSHTTVLYHAVESGAMAQPSKGIASFHFEYQTAAGAYEIARSLPCRIAHVGRHC